MAMSRPLGADYHFYFNRNLGENLMKSDLKTTWVNRVIIITDGYLEPEDRAPLTVIEASRAVRAWVKFVADSAISASCNPDSDSRAFVRVTSTIDLAD